MSSISSQVVNGVVPGRSPPPHPDILHKGAIVQPSDPGRAFKGLGVAKRYCRRDLISDSFVQYRPAAVAPPQTTSIFGTPRDQLKFVEVARSPVARRILPGRASKGAGGEDDCEHRIRSGLRNRFSVICLGTRFLRRTPIGQVQILPASQPLLVNLSQDGRGQSQDRGFIREDPDHSGGAPDLPVDPFQCIDGADLAMGPSGKTVDRESFRDVLLQPLHPMGGAFSGKCC